MAQGNLKLKKNPEKKAKAVRGDQQKLKVGRNMVIKPGIAKRTSQFSAQQDITKQIVNRIEKTMASRAATDGAGLSMVKDDGEEGGRKTLLKAPILGKKFKKR
eukprot:CAMPEP_0181214906 /NCGR_PEP_ID=MMETSP1096-20121128/25720_1 /TAXON_ID=156174 ORGANISM="Chrysochromulina ericina, Strain CCMP281" /NCGR_SAMPLE_ID=MMETSP1096 /ASSEMBLY_ACC=CAM_ASM_000453 /LENGTH=102 /DNA_ID=CAMNT_0023306707 /DNA_START=18 /DNA_END=326 /DNA_ORIENTATION=+